MRRQEYPAGAGGGGIFQPTEETGQLLLGPPIIILFARIYVITYNIPIKELNFVGTTLGDLRDFPAPARRAAGYQLSQVQRGLKPDDWRPMPAIGPGIIEIRLHEEGEFRVFYLAKLADAIHFLHAFQKKTRKTAPKDIALAKVRLKQIRGGRS